MCSALVLYIPVVIEGGKTATTSHHHLSLGNNINHSHKSKLVKFLLCLLFRQRSYFCMLDARNFVELEIIFSSCHYPGTTKYNSFNLSD
jgi:hypothetical protein